MNPSRAYRTGIPLAPASSKKRALDCEDTTTDCDSDSDSDTTTSEFEFPIKEIVKTKKKTISIAKSRIPLKKAQIDKTTLTRPFAAPLATNPASKPVDRLEELIPAALYRDTVTPILYAPFLDSTVIGCYVQLPDQSYNCFYYFIWKVIGVEELEVSYEFDGKPTNKHMKCQMGRNVRFFKFTDLSNDAFGQNEFGDWLLACKLNGIVTSIAEIERKRLDIQAAVRHRYTDQEVDQMVNENKKFKEGPLNCALEKAKLLRKKELAAQTGDIQQVLHLQEEISKLDGISRERHNRRTNKSSMVTLFTRNHLKQKNKRGGLRFVTGSKSKVTVNDTESTSSLNTMTTPVNLFNFHNIDLDIDMSKLEDVHFKNGLVRTTEFDMRPFLAFAEQ